MVLCRAAANVLPGTRLLPRAVNGLQLSVPWLVLVLRSWQVCHLVLTASPVEQVVSAGMKSSSHLPGDLTREGFASELSWMTVRMSFLLVFSSWQLLPSQHSLWHILLGNSVRVMLATHWLCSLPLARCRSHSVRGQWQKVFNESLMIPLLLLVGQLNT